MDNQKELASIMDKIKKLLALASKNSNAEEAASAAAKAQELMTKYNLDAATIERKSGKADGRREKASIKGGFYNYQRRLMQSLAELNFCMYWSEEYMDTIKKTRTVRGRTYRAGDQRKRTRHRLIGREANVVMVQVMVDYLNEAINRELKNQLSASGMTTKGSQMSNWSISFREGAVNHLTQRIHRERMRAEEARKAAERRAQTANGAASTSTALTIADLAKSEEAANYDFLYGEGAWAKREAQYARWEQEAKEAREKLAKLKEENPEEYARLKAEEAKANKGGRGSRGGGYRKDNTDYEAYESGFKAAKDISLNRQVDEKTTSNATRIGGK